MELITQSWFLLQMLIVLRVVWINSGRTMTLGMTIESTIEQNFKVPEVQVMSASDKFTWTCLELINCTLETSIEALLYAHIHSASLSASNPNCSQIVQCILQIAQNHKLRTACVKRHPACPEINRLTGIVATATGPTDHS